MNIELGACNELRMDSSLNILNTLSNIFNTLISILILFEALHLYTYHYLLFILSILLLILLQLFRFIIPTYLSTVFLIEVN